MPTKLPLGSETPPRDERGAGTAVDGFEPAIRLPFGAIVIGLDGRVLQVREDGSLTELPSSEGIVTFPLLPGRLP